MRRKTAFRGDRPNRRPTYLPNALQHNWTSSPKNCPWPWPKPPNLRSVIRSSSSSTVVDSRRTSSLHWHPRKGKATTPPSSTTWTTTTTNTCHLPQSDLRGSSLIPNRTRPRTLGRHHMIMMDRLQPRRVRCHPRRSLRWRPPGTSCCSRLPTSRTNLTRDEQSIRVHERGRSLITVDLAWRSLVSILSSVSVDTYSVTGERRSYMCPSSLSLTVSKMSHRRAQEPHVLP